MKHSGAGFSLVELMVTVAVVGMIASLVVPNSSPDRDRLQLDAAARRLQLGLERARLAARRAQQACGISLGSEAWMEPVQQTLPGALAHTLASLAASASAFAVHAAAASSPGVHVM